MRTQFFDFALRDIIHEKTRIRYEIQNRRTGNGACKVR